MTGDENSLGRRSYLRALGATAVAGALAGCGDRDPEPTRTTRETTEGPTATPPTETTRTTEETTTEATTENFEERFETVVNVADAGADDAGEEPVNSVLDDHLGDDTLLYFPEGRYRLDQWNVVGYRNLGLVGDDAVLVPPDERYWFQFGDLREFLLDGFAFDGREPGVAPTNHLSVTGGESVVRDVTWRGHRDAPRSGFDVAVANPDAELRFERVRLPDGSTGGSAIYTFPESVGRLVFEDCRVEHWAEGLYASPHSGPLAVVGGYYANNGIDQVRVGGGPSGAVVRDVTVRVDDPQQPDSKPNMRGIWMEEGARVRIENCDVAITDLTGTYSSGAIVVGRQFGAATIENTRVRTDADAPGIHVRHPVERIEGQVMPSMDELPDDWRLTCRNVRLTGEAASGNAVRITERDDCGLEGVCIHHPEGERNGVRVVRADDCAVSDSTIAVGGEAVETDEATVETSRVRRDGSC